MSKDHYFSYIHDENNVTINKGNAKRGASPRLKIWCGGPWPLTLKINILQWILTKLGTCLVLKRIWNPIDFQGHCVKFFGRGYATLCVAVVLFCSPRLVKFAMSVHYNKMICCVSSWPTYEFDLWPQGWIIQRLHDNLSKYDFSKLFCMKATNMNNLGWVLVWKRLHFHCW